MAAPVSQLERERKYELGAGGQVPILAGAGAVARQEGPVEQLLDATYFDTTDYRLARAGITLRRRTGGDDAGWHLKLPVSSDTREELHVPLRRNNPSKVPGRLARLVTAYTAGSRLVPIAHLKTDRFSYRLADADGRVLATLTDDHVTGEAGGAVAHIDSWRELEVELEADAEPRLLDDLDRALVPSGASASKYPSKMRRLVGELVPKRKPVKVGKNPDAGTVVLAYLREQFDHLRRNDIGVRRDADDAVHQMRVASRRLRGAFRTFKKIIDVPESLAAELKWLAGELGPARDTEVMAATLNKQLDGLPPEFVLGRVRQLLVRHFSREGEEARTRAVEALNSKRYLALLSSLDDVLDAPPLTKRARRPARKELRKAVRKAGCKLARAEAATHGASDRDPSDLDVALHETRKKAKRARYAADAVKPVLGKKLGKWRKKVKAVQGTLGEHQDTVVTRETLYRLGIGAFRDGDNSFTYGLLHGCNTELAHEKQREFRAQWAKLPALPKS
ncbi:CHAD domain-containing protein [Amycolatopsis xylanica]|uniref:CHAD domain-containing protein n=1 Tax=Amycolatopsis xylanica TaxID=589385 RepID=A0A1H3JYI4_9PSEU|nr:CYTH and CHAD domain-containing protein [Amycolatopsis xylanica]SDY44378.1 CHAD domain-containing protein [Amycolatopsis xylanica]